MNITIVGCGTLGSSLAYALSLKSIEGNVDSITLVDNDVIEEKNLPYLYVNNKVDYDKFIGSPKVICLQYIIKQITHIPIYRYYDKYEDVKFNNDQILIDSRDTGSQDSIFKYKLNIDGSFGRIIVNPEYSSSIPKKRNKYIIGDSRYYSHIFSFLVCEKVLFNYPNFDRKEIIIDLRDGKLHDVPRTFK